MVTTAPYGSWRSPIGVEDLTAGSTGLDAVRVDGDDLYWLESRPDQGGRVSLWRRPFGGGEASELCDAAKGNFKGGVACSNSGGASGKSVPWWWVSRMLR